MAKRCEKIPKSIVTILLLFFGVLTVVFSAQQGKKVDPQLLAELTGAYELEIQRMKGVYLFIEEEGRLKGAPAGEKPFLLEPVEGEDLTFVGYYPDDIEHQYKFLRDEEGKIAKCILSIPEMGLVVHMIKMKK